MTAYHHLINAVSAAAVPIKGGAEKYDTLMAHVGDARFVLLGEATHGTAEFYQTRIEISKRLILEKGFSAITIEGDWPDVYHVHRYVQGQGSPSDSQKVLSHFKRFPTWMWNNSSILSFIEWLRAHNDRLSLKEKISFYGLDLYSFYHSMHAVIHYLDHTNPADAALARRLYACFDHAGMDPQYYGLQVSEGLKKSCRDEALVQVLSMQQRAYEYLKHDGLAAQEEYFYAMQNAKVVQNAERYYRSMYESRESSWNNRDQHMFETFESIIGHLETRLDHLPKIIVWAHNSHVGDARATEMGSRGEINIGQLIRERYPHETYNMGFSTYEGTVKAASEWDGEAEIKQVVPGMEGSYEALFHDVNHGSFWLPLRSNKNLAHYLHVDRLQRAIGVIYAPRSERYSHYFFTCLPYQFDSIIHIDKTTAV